MHEHDFGSYLAKERRNAGLTLRKLSSLSNLAASTLSRWENNHVSPVRADVEKVDKALEMNGRLVTIWEFATSGFPSWMRDVSRLEEAAHMIELISPHLVPGLLQCEDYTREVFKEGLLPGTPEEIDRLVALRCGRYDRLRSANDPLITAVFPETALTFAPEPARSAQVRHLLELSRQGRVTIHLIPAGTLLLGVTSMLLMFHLQDGGKAAVSDHVDGATLYEDTRTYDRLHGLVKRALGSALPTKQSLEVLENLQ
ncbi:helix-turn-helix domain-containing protein [Nocardiopsis sp. NPDC057823]|uniref:helix-turn-helix domain-containing protein n=1 Tax=Nocardiopsis sp. NPDC057823 TaxID=3346256 RepID=UPI00366C3FB8